MAEFEYRKAKDTQKIRSGISTNLISSLNHPKDLHRFGLYVRWGNGLPNILDQSDVVHITIAEVLADPRLIAENVFYDVHVAR